MDDIKIRLMSAPWHAGSDVLLLCDNGKRRVKSIEVVDFDPAIVQEPTFHLTPEDSQTLMDDLWNAGFRPTEGSGSAGSLRATEKHLNDFRKLVSKTLEVEL